METVLDELGVDCNQCGRCCLALGGFLQGSEEDLTRWREAGAEGARIAAWARVTRREGEVVSVDLWFEPSPEGRSGSLEGGGEGFALEADEGAREWLDSACPWVEQLSEGRYGCSIYALRPTVCRHFPAHVEQVESYCEPGGVVVPITSWDRL